MKLQKIMSYSKVLFFTIFIFSSFTFLTGCSEDDSSAVTPPAVVNPKTTVTHASPNAPNVDILVGENIVATNVPYLSTLPYTALNVGDNRIRVNVTGTSTTVIDATLPFADGANYSIFAVDSVNKISAIRVDDDLTTPASGNSHVRFIHLSPNAPAVDIAVTGGPVLFPDYSFKEFSNFTPVAAATYDLEVRLAGTSTVVLSLPNITLENGKIYTVYARGFVGATGTDQLGASIIANN